MKIKAKIVFLREISEDILVVVLRPVVLAITKPKYAARQVVKGLRAIPSWLRRCRHWCWDTRLGRTVSLGLVLALVAMPVFYLFFAPQTEAAWWDDMWRYRKKLTIDHDQVAGELSNFPVLVSLTDSDLAAAAQSDGDDIAFTDANGNKYSHEIESNWQTRPFLLRTFD